MIRALLWNHKTFEEVTLDPNSETPIYQQVNELIDARTMTLQKFNEDIEAYVDDEGLLVDEPIYGAIWVYPTGKVIQGIGGKILFVNHNEQGETIDLTYEQMKRIKHLMKHQIPTSKGDKYEALIIEHH